MIKIRDIKKDIVFTMIKSVYENNLNYKNDKNLEVVKVRKTKK